MEWEDVFHPPGVVYSESRGVYIDNFPSGVISYGVCMEFLVV